MKRLSLISVLGILFLAAPLCAGDPPAGFESLFNGKDLTGWKATGKMDKWGADNGVIYCPFWEFNPGDKQDAVILWRWPSRLDWTINADRVFIDLHDAMTHEVLLENNRIAKLDCIFVKSDYQKSLLRNISEAKIAVIPNGIDLSLLEGDEEKDPEINDELYAVIQNVVTHLVGHDFANLRERALLEQVVVQGDAGGAQKARDVCTDAV